MTSIWAVNYCGSKVMTYIRPLYWLGRVGPGLVWSDRVTHDQVYLAMDVNSARF
jgi:hypothetical protein